MGYGVAAVSNDTVPVIKHFSEVAGIAYTLLADAKSKMIGAFNLLDPRHPPSSRWHGLASPMIVVIDKAGVVQRRFSSNDYRRRPSVNLVLKQLQ